MAILLNKRPYKVNICFKKILFKYIIINKGTFTFNPHTAKKSSLYGLPVIDKTIKGTGADAKRCRNGTVLNKKCKFFITLKLD